MAELLILLILLVLSGVFSGSETALVSISLGRAEALAKEGRRGAAAVYRLKRHPSRMLITILIGNNVVNIAASAMATVLATRWLGHFGPGVAVGVLTILILIFGEITPKSLATRYAERISLIIAPLLVAFMRAIYPLVWIFNELTNQVQRLSGAQADPMITEAELIRMMEHGEKEGTIESDEREMIERVFRLNDLKAGDVMTPMRGVFTLDGRRSLDELLPEVMQRPYSRIPLHGADSNEILKVLFLRDLFDAVVAGRTGSDALSIGRTPLFVPENQKIDVLLPWLRREKQHMAVVVDETGYLQGVVTLEDLLEELVGEIYDEVDELPDQTMVLAEGRILVDGHVELRVVEELLDIELPGKPTDTVSYWILSFTERIPLEGENLRLDGLDICVQSASARRIRQVAISRQSDSAAESEPQS
ncbi:HlyC/CorC family transporter [Thiorhodococcus mannitoliphagus]|uniref:HlyC/CorC family transporter n=1 Tax=Thiorhodococcus mannitoliphagus TaxID=329406 RepID=A0A6P1E3A6_9GAMM|nr:hemolysin family protein [Thiorhodococcus mannitoliphagus]NEX22972.1 HlyC/CorC family transporter [Thiorhodococcus mannitoliphagus]